MSQARQSAVNGICEWGMQFDPGSAERRLGVEWYQDSRLVLAVAVENLVLLVAAMGCFLLYIRRSRTQKSNEEYELLDMLNRYYSQSADHVKRSYDQINMLKHDMRNLLLVTANLISQGKSEEAGRLLEEKLHQIDRIYRLVDTDNEYANAILNQKLSEAKEAGMEVRCVILTTFAGIGNQDICSIFGNLLDNAIEANEGNGDRSWLEVVVEGDRDTLEIICRNSIYKSLRYDSRKRLLTTKAFGEHGYGGRIIRETAEKYGGEVAYHAGERELEAAVRLRRRPD